MVSRSWLSLAHITLIVTLHGPFYSTHAPSFPPRLAPQRPVIVTSLCAHNTKEEDTGFAFFICACALFFFSGALTLAFWRTHTPSTTAHTLFSHHTTTALHSQHALSRNTTQQQQTPPFFARLFIAWSCFFCDCVFVAVFLELESLKHTHSTDKNTCCFS